MIEAGVLGLRLSPIATGFWREADAKLRAQKASNAEIKVEANIRKASTEIAMFRMREQANAINLKVKVDEKSIRTATDKIKYIEHTWKQSDIKRAVRVQVYVAGASALPALTQGLMSVTAAMTELSRVSLALPGLLAGIGSAAATLFTGLNGVGAAFKASNDGMQKSSQYARQYAQASRELENAQRDVVKALKDANRELEDQKSKLARGQLSVEQAQLSVRRANEAVFKGGFKSITDYQQALLDVKSANLDLAEAVKQNSRNIGDYYENAARGAAGSNAFKDSLDKLSNSVDNFHKAQFQAAGMSEQFINAMKNLAPAGQDFVLQVLKMKGAWTGLQNSVQTTLFKGLGDEITNLANRQLPVLKTGMQQVAAGLNDSVKAIFQTLGRQSNSNSIAKIFENTGKAISAATPGVDSFTSGLLKLSEVGTRFLPRMALAFDKVMGKFESFINKADSDGSLNKWIDSGLKLVASLGRSLLSIGSILNSVTEAYNKATGNVGGFASTMERGLAGFAKKLASPEGQGALIKWMRTSREFMATISASLPGIGKIFKAIGEGAREFAAIWFPKLAWFGEKVGGASGALKTLVAVMFSIRTVKPVFSEAIKLWNLLNASMQKYTEKKAAILSTKNAAWKAAFDADGVKFAAQERLRALEGELKESELIYAQSRNQRAKALEEVKQARDARLQFEKAAKASKKNNQPTAPTATLNGQKYIQQPDGTWVAGPGGSSFTGRSSLAAAGAKFDDEASKAKQKRYLSDAKAYKQAKEIEKKALENFNLQEERLYRAAATRSTIHRDLEAGRGKAYRDLKVATDLASKAQENFNKVNRLTADGMSGRLARATDSLKGKYGQLKSAMGWIGGVGASAGFMVGAALAFDQLTAAQDRNRASADNLKESQDALGQTLSKGTGSATAATLEENARQLQNRADPYQPDDPRANFNAAEILQHQLGISLAEASTLSLPSEVKRREARLNPGDAQVIAAVPGLQEWKQWGKDYQANGVTASVYGKALNGDPESIAKVEAARHAIKDGGSISKVMPFGVAVNSGFAPNDLGTAQQQLSDAGAYGGLRGLSKAVGAERSIGNEALAQGNKIFGGAGVIPQNGLNTRGMRVFGPFALGSHGAVIHPDGSATIEVDRYPDDIVKGWIDGASDKGISVERRYPDGAVISIDPEHGRQYFNGYARGGPVWGAGTATSDSIPAMLSNGEYVINAKSAAMIGHDTLNQMNSMKKYANGGLVRGFAPGGSVDGDGGGIWDKIGGFFSGVADALNPFKPIPEKYKLPSGQGTPTTDPVAPAPDPVPAPPLIRTDAVDSSPVTLPLPANTPPPPGPDRSKGIGANLGNGILYIPMFGGSGALQDFGTTGLSAVEKAPVNRDANILDYLVQVANANGLRAGSGPADTEAGREIAKRFGIPTHGAPDGMQHDINRALDIGSVEQAQDGSITKFVKSWLADPEKVRATRQLIFKDPSTGEAFGIINGRALSGDELYSVYGSAFDGHTDHLHLAMEGVPLQAFSQSSAPVGIGLPPRTGSSDPDAFKNFNTAAPSVPSAPPLAPGPAASAPKGPTAISPPGTIPGPFGDIPFDPIYILKQIGAAILNGIFAFFGVDGSGFVDALFALGDNKDVGPKVDEIPEPDANLVSGLDAQIAQYEALGTPAGKEMAEKIKAGKNDYLKQFEAANAAKSAESAAAYFDSIGQPDVARNLRKGVTALGPNPNEKNPERFGPVTTVPGSGGLTAPKANYSGGTPETHNAIYRAFKEAGYPDSEWPALVELLNHENDTWDPTRPTGGPNSDARGIFQFLSSTWGAVGMQPSDDPYQQAVAGMKYIKQNYGNPSGAWNFWQHPTRAPFDQNWYSLGGLAKFARGGKVTGPGSGTSDSIPAMLSAGEYVMRADAVKHWGEDRLHAMNCYSGGGLVGYAPGGVVQPIDPSKMSADQQKQMFLSAFNPTPSQDWVGGGADSLPENSWWDSTRENVSNFGTGIAGGAQDLMVGLAPLVGAGNAVNNMIGQGDVKAPGVGESWKGLASGLAPLVGAGNVVNNALGVEGQPAAGVGDSWKNLWKAASRYDQWTGGQKAQAAGGNLFDILTVLLPGGAGAKAARAGQLGARTSELGTLSRVASMAGEVGRAAGAVLPGADIAAAVSGKGIVKGIDAAKMAVLRQQYLRGIDFDLNGLSRRTKTEVKNNIALLRQVEPNVALDRVRALDFNSIDSLKQSDAWARAISRPSEHVYTDPVTGLEERYPRRDFREIELNTAWWADRKKLNKSYSESIASGWAVDPGRKGNIAAILAHEYGHILDYHFGDNFYPWDIEEILRNSFQDDSPFGPGLFGDASQDYPDTFIEYLRNYFPEKYSYYGGNVEQQKQYTRQLLDSAQFNPEGAVALALQSINRNELVANTFSEIFLHGNKASMASKNIYQAWREAGNNFEKYDTHGNGFGTKLPKILPGNVAGSSKVFDSRGEMKPPRPGLNLKGRTNPANSWDDAVAKVNEWYPFQVEEAKANWNPLKLVGDKGVTKSGSPAGMISKVRNEVPLGSPFDYDSLRELFRYSDTSSVNKTLRGDDKLPDVTNILKGLLPIEPKLGGIGGPFGAGFKRKSFDEGGFGNSSSINASVLARFRERLDKGMSPEKAFADLPGFFKGADPRMLWELLFVRTLASANQRASRALTNLDAVKDMDRAFSAVPGLPEDLWVTRFVDSLGPDFDLNDPASIVGRNVPNAGYTSTSVGITANPKAFSGLEWSHRGAGPSAGKNPFQDRDIMKQILVPAGTPGVWFGGSEGELVLPRNVGMDVLGQQDIRAAAGLSPEDARYADEVAKKMEELTGRKTPRKTKLWGVATPGGDSGAMAQSALGFDNLAKIVAPLMARDADGNPRWLSLVNQPEQPAVAAERALLGYGGRTNPESYTEFRDMPQFSNLPWTQKGGTVHSPDEWAAGGLISGPGGPKSDMIPAMLSNGEFVMNAAAVKRYGLGTMNSMNFGLRKFAPGGPVSIDPNLIPPPPSGSSDPDAFKNLDTPPPPSGSSDPDAFKDLSAISTKAKEAAGSALGSILSPKGAGSASGGAKQAQTKDPRATLAQAPRSSDHNNPAFSGAIEGAFSTIGSLAGTAASLAIAGGTGGIGAAGSGAAGAGISAGAQMAGQVASGALNILSSFLVGTVTPSDTGQGYGAPLLPQAPQNQVSNFQSIHNGNVVTNNLSEYSRLKDRKDAQKAAPFFNRVKS